MLDEIIFANRFAILGRTSQLGENAQESGGSGQTPLPGIDAFLDELATALRRGSASPSQGHSQLRATAARHGLDCWQRGLTIGRVVRTYGHVCQAITSLVIDQDIWIGAVDFKMLNYCLDEAIAEAVSEFARAAQRAESERQTERSGILAHQQRDLLNTAVLAHQNSKVSGMLGDGRADRVLTRSLLGLRQLVERSLEDARLDAGLQDIELISVDVLVAELEFTWAAHALARDLKFVVAPFEDNLSIEGDRQVLTLALGNLLQNAFKFTKGHGVVRLTVQASYDRVVFDVEDECGGLPTGNPARLFLAYEQRGSDRSGLGLGLAICQKAAQASQGILRVRDLPGRGCIFSFDLPRVRAAN